MSTPTHIASPLFNWTTTPCGLPVFEVSIAEVVPTCPDCLGQWRPDGYISSEETVFAMRNQYEEAGLTWPPLWLGRVAKSIQK